MMKGILGVLAGAVLLTACGGSDPGSGTQTLFVQATAESDGSPDGSKLTVVVKNGSSSGANLDTAMVTLIGDRGTTYTVPWTGATLFGVVLGDYHMSSINWEGGWRLRITNANDNLEAYIAGPGLTDITAPAENSTFVKSSAQNLVVTWKDEMGRAMPNASVKFRRANVDRTTQDTGSFPVDSATLVAATDERITITRWVDVSLKGGITGSSFRAQTTTERNIIVQ